MRAITAMMTSLVLSAAVGCGSVPQADDDDDVVDGDGGAGDIDAGDVAQCGNGTQEDPEECDDEGESASCDGDCTAVVCGDGYLNLTAGEACDDGNTEGGDFCDPNCSPISHDLFAVDTSDYVAFIGGQPDVAVGVTDGGDEVFLVTYITIPADGTSDVRLQAFDAAGNSLGEEHILSNAKTYAITPRIGTNADGLVVVAWWEGLDQKVPFLMYHVLQPGGIPDEAGPQLLPDSTGVVGPPSVSGGAGDLICIGWAADDANGHIRCIDGSGNLAGSTQTIGPVGDDGDLNIIGAVQLFPISSGLASVRADAGDQFVLRKISSSGSPTGGDEVISTRAVGNSTFHLGSGYANDGDAFITGFTVPGVYEGKTETTRALVQRVDGSGNPVGLDILVNTTNSEFEIAPDFVGMGDRFLAVYSAVNADGDSVPVYGRIGSASAGTFEDVPFEIASIVEPGDTNYFAKNAMTSAGDVMVVWNSFRLDGKVIPAATRAFLFPRILAP